MVFENVLYEVKDGILYLTLNRPEKNNALTPEMWNDIKNAAEAAWLDPEVQVVIVSGAGDRALASGADIREIHDRESLRMLEGRSTIALKALEDLFKPTICAVNGYALGGGCELAMACDIRIATARSRFGQPETGLGIMPGAGGTQRLSRLVGPAKAKELIFTGKIIHADEAEKIGLVNMVTGDTREELMEAAQTMARKILEKGPVATRMAKMCINMGQDIDINSGLLFERVAQTVVFCSEDRKEGTAAFLEKRAPEFKGK